MACVFLTLFSGFSARLSAQAVPGGKTPGAEEKGLTMRVAFEGSTSSDGQIFDLNSSTGYIFNQHFSVGVGVPIYFVYPSTTVTGTSARASSTGDLGDFYGVASLSLDNPVAAYSTSFTLTAPTGNADRGRSTGQVTYDWDNRFDHEWFDRVTPYIDAGLANSISNTRFFKRPFITLGHLAHFEAGADIKLAKMLTFTASAYDVLPWGQQHVFSRIVRRGSSGLGGSGRRVFENNFETIGGADLTRDNGYSAGLGFSPSPLVDFSVGFTRSVPLHLNTLSFSVGFNISRLFRHRTQ